MAVERIPVQVTIEREFMEVVDLGNGQTTEVMRRVQEVITQWIEVEVPEDLDAAQEQALRELITEHISIDANGDVSFDRDGFEVAAEAAMPDVELGDLDKLQTALEGIDEQIDTAVGDTYEIVDVPAATVPMTALPQDDFSIQTVSPGDAMRTDLEGLLYQRADGGEVYLTTGVPNPNIAPEVVDGLVTAVNEGRVPAELVQSLAEAAHNGDELAAAALFALAFQHLDAPTGETTGQGWTEATGVDWFGGNGGNCATFLSTAYLYAGMGDEALAWDAGDSSIPNGDGRGASELSYLFLANWQQPDRGNRVEPENFSELQPGDFIYQGSELQDLPPDDMFDHVSMVVGFGPVDGGPDAPLFASYDEAVAFYGQLDPPVAVTPWVADHNPANHSASPRPWPEANPFEAADRFGVHITDPDTW